jgi:predicted nucleic acid-binding protein
MGRRNKKEKLFFLDSSALTKIYIREKGSRELERLVGKRARGFRPAVKLLVSRLAFPETLSAITKHENKGAISRAAAVRLWKQVFDDFMFPPSPYAIHEPTEGVVAQAAMMVAQHGLRAYDAVQLSTAQRIRANLPEDKELVFVSSDRRLNNVARKEQFDVADPIALAEAVNAPKPA